MKKLELLQKLKRLENVISDTEKEITSIQKNIAQKEYDAEKDRVETLNPKKIEIVEKEIDMLDAEREFLNQQKTMEDSLYNQEISYLDAQNNFRISELSHGIEDKIASNNERAAYSQIDYDLEQVKAPLIKMLAGLEVRVISNETYYHNRTLDAQVDALAKVLAAPIETVLEHKIGK